MQYYQKEKDEGGAAVAEGGLLDTIVQETRLSPADESYSMTRKGLQVFVDEMLKPERTESKVSTAVVDELIAAIDGKISAQMDEILHNADFQKLESAWKGLKYLVDHTDYRENNRTEIGAHKPFEVLIEAIKRHELPLENYRWYVDLRRYGTVTHSGFGLGLERTVAWICGIPHIRQTSPFARTINRMRP